VLISEQTRAAIFSALSESQRRHAFEYGLAVTWSRLPQYAQDLVTTEWWNNKPAASEAPVAMESRQHRADCDFMKRAPAVQGPCNCSQLSAADFFAAERVRIGNTPECEECGESLDNCECGGAATQLSLFSGAA
jgi:hypothetical protein